ncbi:hypothetical protein LINGRAHAP2_LOCUS17713 [Linum grandiflorum]
MPYVAARQLPEEIEEKIVKEHLTTFTQLVSFSGVSRSLRSIAKEINISCFPGILVSKTSCPDDRCKEDHCNLHECRNTGRCRRCNTPHHQFRPISTIFNSTITASGVTPPPPRPPLMWSPQDCASTRKMMLRGPYGSVVDLEKCHCVASKDGWLVLAQQYYSRIRIYLLNPITGASIHLPPLECEGYESGNHIIIFKVVVLSSSPDDHDCRVIVLFNTLHENPRIACCKVRGGCWKFITRGNNFMFYISVESACYIGGKLYVVDDDEKCVNVIDNLINVMDDDEVVEPIARLFPLSSVVPPPDDDEIEFHPMELNGQLILVVRPHHVQAFRVYKLLEEEDPCSNSCWEEIRSLDGHATFLGTHQSFCVPVNKNNETMIRVDHVYYLGNNCGQCELRYCHSCLYKHRRREFGDRGFCGVFNLVDGKLVEHSRLPKNSYQDYTWFLPMPWDIHKHLKNFKKEKMPPKPKEIDHKGFERLYVPKKTYRGFWYRKQVTDNRIIPCHNSFKGLALDD